MVDYVYYVHIDTVTEQSYNIIHATPHEKCVHCKNYVVLRGRKRNLPKSVTNSKSSVVHATVSHLHPFKSFPSFWQKFFDEGEGYFFMQK
jgi:hypothetical protein